MAVVATFAESFIEDVFKKVHDLTSDTLQLRLLDTSYTFDPETDTDWTDISANEVAEANGYTAGGITLTGVAVAATAMASDGVINITCTNNPTWTASGGSIGSTNGAALVNASTTPEKIIMVIDFDGTYTATVGLMIQVDLSGGVGTATISIPAGG